MQLTVVGPRHHVVVRRRIKAHSPIHGMTVMMWMVMVVHVGWNWRLRIVMSMMIFLARAILMRSIVMVGSKMIVSVLRLSVVHVRIVVIAVRPIIYGVVVIISIVAWFILHIPTKKTAQSKLVSVGIKKCAIFLKVQLTEDCEAHEWPPGQP